MDKAVNPPKPMLMLHCRSPDKRPPGDGVIVIILEAALILEGNEAVIVIGL